MAVRMCVRNRCKGRSAAWNHNDVANLERAVGVQRNSGEEVSQRVLQSETDNHAEDCRGGDKAAQIYLLIDAIEDQDK